MRRDVAGNSARLIDALVPTGALVLALVLAGALILAGAPMGACARTEPPQAEQAAAGKSSSVRVTDEMGRGVTVPQPVRRIVSLAPSVTETLFALGLGDRVVGDTNYCDYPAEAKSKTRVGGPVDPNLETIAALHPDLVVATRSINRQSTVNSLEHLGIAVYATDPRTVEQVLSSTERLGRLIRGGGAKVEGTDKGGELATQLRSRLGIVRDAIAGVAPKSVFFVVWQEPLITVGRNTFLADALRWAGARPALAPAQDWPNVSLEAVIRAAPEYLIFSSDDRAKALQQIAGLRNQPGWKTLAAMRANRIIVLPEAISHPSPRLVDAIEELARALYPERFGEKGAALAGTAGTRGRHAASDGAPDCASPLASCFMSVGAAVCAQASACGFVGCDLGRGWL
jgi:iron complex transport system substrate-binding protein